MNPEEDLERAANEATFRDANERIRSAEARIEPPLENAPYLCECDDVGCHELIPLSREEYEAVRRDGAVFAILPGHSTLGGVIEDHGRYLVVRKTGAEERVVRVRDPRKRQA